MTDKPDRVHVQITSARNPRFTKLAVNGIDITRAIVRDGVHVDLNDGAPIVTLRVAPHVLDLDLDAATLNAIFDQQGDETDA